MMANFASWAFGRLWPLMLVLLLGAFPSAPWVVTSAAQRSATPVPGDPPLLDLAWLMPVPSDLPDPGYQSQSAQDSTSTSLRPELAHMFDTSGQAFLAAAVLPGWQQAYLTHLVLPNERNWQTIDCRIDVTVYQFTEAAGAAAGLAALRGIFHEAGYEAMGTPPDVGEDGVFLRGRAANPNHRPNGYLLGLTRLGNLVVEVDVSDLTGVAPSTSLPTAIMTRIAAQLPVVLAGHTPNLSHRVVRLARPDIEVPRGWTDRDQYRRRENVQLPILYPGNPERTPTLTSIFGSFAEEHGIQDWYTYDATRMRSGLSVTCIMNVFLFRDAAAATEYLPKTDREVAAFVAQDMSDAQDVRLVRPRDVGADAILGTYAVTGEPGHSYGAMGWVRVDDAVTQVMCNGFPERSETALSHLLREAIACLEQTCSLPS